MKCDSEQRLIRAIVNALLGEQAEMEIKAEGTYSRGNRWIEVTLDQAETGVLIGQGGNMKLAIQTILACPMGADSVQVRFRSKKQPDRKRILPHNRAPDRNQIESVMSAIADYHIYKVKWRLEATESVVVVLSTVPRIFLDEFAAPIARIIRAIGKLNGYQATTITERDA